MKKIIFILLTVFAAATNAFAADKPIKWKLAETWPANFPIYGEATKEFAKRVEEMSNGRLIISIDSANKHKSALGIFDFVKSGQYQMGHSASYYWKGKDINTLFFTTMPFGMISAERTAWYHNGGGAELAKRAYSKHGITQYPAGSGSQMGGWFKKEINSVDDLKGLKMRIPGFAGEVLAKVGATVTNVPPGELYTSLERNTIDALEWVGPSFDLRMGFHKIAQYYYTGWHEPGSEIQFMVNNEAFDKLPKDLQAILKAAMRESETSVTDRLYYENGANWEKIKNDFPNIKVKTFPPDVMAALRDANKELVDKLEEKGGLTAEIIESQRKFKKQVREWTNISDKAYLNN